MSDRRSSSTDSSRPRPSKARPQRRNTRHFGSDRPQGKRTGGRKPSGPQRSGSQRSGPQRYKSDRVGANRPVKPSAVIPAHEKPSESPDLIYGRHAIEAALENKRPLNRLWINARHRYDGRFLGLINEAKANGVVIDEADPRRLNQIAQGQNHQGIIAQVAAYDYWDLETLITHARSQSIRPVL
ncbi:MAG: 23S rRNA (guanosine(2251)-2'-O)-methyltransferase RlmB, partial [Leptolyngbya sp. SIO1D8]|nr:23S rRNA (guanosine(2251)-2'-O)-methyltransferase RlmB [Leptolyngbya sp. SIO1D8]